MSEVRDNLRYTKTHEWVEIKEKIIYFKKKNKKPIKLAIDIESDGEYDFLTTITFKPKWFGKEEIVINYKRNLLLIS